MEAKVMYVTNPVYQSKQKFWNIFLGYNEVHYIGP